MIAPALRFGCTAFLGRDFFIVDFRSPKVRLVNAAFAEQKTTTFSASQIKSQPNRDVMPATRSFAQGKVLPFRHYASSAFFRHDDMV